MPAAGKRVLDFFARHDSTVSLLVVPTLSVVSSETSLSCIEHCAAFRLSVDKHPVMGTTCCYTGWIFLAHDPLSGGSLCQAMRYLLPLSRYDLLQCHGILLLHRCDILGRDNRCGRGGVTRYCRTRCGGKRILSGGRWRALGTRSHEWRVAQQIGLDGSCRTGKMGRDRSKSSAIEGRRLLLGQTWVLGHACCHYDWAACLQDECPCCQATIDL